MHEKFPAQAYKDNVLKDCFRDAQHYFLDHYLDIDRAHVVMFVAQNTTAPSRTCFIIYSGKLPRAAAIRMLPENCILRAAETISM